MKAELNNSILSTRIYPYQLVPVDFFEKTHIGKNFSSGDPADQNLKYDEKSI